MVGTKVFSAMYDMQHVNLMSGALGCTLVEDGTLHTL